MRTAATFDFETKSSYKVRVRSTDSGGLFTEQALTITVTNVPDAVVAVLDVTPNPPALGEPVILDASSSYDEMSGQQIVRYAWDFGDGTTYVETPNSAPDGAFDGRTRHTYLRFGTFPVTLTVTDDSSSPLTDQDTTTVSVTKRMRRQLT